MKNNKGFIGIGIIIAIIAAFAVAGGFIYYSSRTSTPAPQNPAGNNYYPPEDQNNTPPTTNNNPVVNNQTQSLVNCSHNKLGISFDYPKGYFYDQAYNPPEGIQKPPSRPNCVFIVPDEFGTVDAGKMIAGYIASSSNFTMFIGGATKNISFPGELNAADVQSYPDANQIKSWNDRGYKTEKKINKNNQEYILVHGQPEIDMPYLSENQLLAVFRLKSAKDFSAVGFQLVGGNSAVFTQIIDSIKIF